MNEIIIFTDGGSRGNPGPAALGVYIQDLNGKELARIGKRLGETTNNIAEYSAIVEGLLWCLENKNKLKIGKINFYMDSLLAYSQISGIYKIKNDKLRMLIFEIKKLENQIALPISYAHIRREKNKMADLMVNQALDYKI